MNTLTRWFSKLSIKSKVQYICVMCMVLTIIFSASVLIFVFRIKLTDTYKSKNEDKLNSVYKSYTSVIETANNMSKLIMVNDSVINYLRDTSGQHTNDGEVRKELYGIVNSFSGSYTVFVLKQIEEPVSHIIRTGAESDAEFNNATELKTYYVNTAIGIMRPFDNVLFSDRWYGVVSKLKGGYTVFSNSMNAFSFNTKTEIISFTRVINDLDTQKPAGLLVINIPVSELEETYENFVSDENSFSYVDSTGKRICSSMDKTYLNNLLSEKREFIQENGNDETINNNVISSRRITDTGIYIMCSSEFSFFEDISSEVLIIILGVLIVILIMIMVISKYINKYVTSPIAVLSEVMQKSGSGAPLLIDNFTTSEDEIGRLQARYNDMTLKINRLLEEVVEQEKQRQKAEMTVVQEQMKPHFLYNTLDTIGCMALQNTREDVYDAIETLGTFYRKFLSKGNETITVNDELSIVQSYIKLLRLRYDDMFEDEYFIEDELRSVMIIKLILQPLVENSIYHGIRPKGERGLIRISVYSENNRIHIRVYDTGVGMSDEQIDKLINGSDKMSFGFKRTIDRIKSFYQNDAYVSIKSTEGEFCDIDINIPYRH